MSGGSLLSVGSAVAAVRMGQAHGVYTFGRYLIWVSAIGLVYAASIYVHLLLNAALFHCTTKPDHFRDRALLC